MAKRSRSRNSNRRARTTEEFNPDYTDIKNDLKQIGTLAGIFLVILVALSFILQ